MPNVFFCATGVVRPADGNRFAVDAGLILAVSLSLSCRTGVRVEVIETPEATRLRTLGTPTAAVAVVFFAVVPTVRVLTVESVEPPDVLRDRAPLEPADVGVSSVGAVRNVESEVAEDRLELGRTTEEGIRRVERPLVAW